MILSLLHSCDELFAMCLHIFFNVIFEGIKKAFKEGWEDKFYFYIKIIEKY